MKKLGLRPPKKTPCIKLADILTGVVPAHPPTADHFASVGDWGMYANDRYGVCGPTCVANSRKLVTRYLGDTEVSPTQQDVFDLYRRSGNPGFDPATGNDDNGVDMQTMCEEVTKGGIGGTKAVAFAGVDVTNLEELKAAIAIFGFGMQAVNLQHAQSLQTDGGLWDFAPSAPWGGHCVLSGLYTDATGKAAALKVVTWAQVVGETRAFLQRQLEQFWVLIWPEHFGTRHFQEGIDVTALAAAFHELTGRSLPIPAPPPSPRPDPSPPSPAPLPSIRAQIDAAFALLEARFASNPFVLGVIKWVHRTIDAYLDQHPGAVGQVAVSAELAPKDLLAILDELLVSIAVTLSPPWSGYIAIVHALLDALLTHWPVGKPLCP